MHVNSGLFALFTACRLQPALVQPGPVGGGGREGGRVSSDSVAVWRTRISSLKVNYALIVM